MTVFTVLNKGRACLTPKLPSGICGGSTSKACLSCEQESQYPRELCLAGFCLFVLNMRDLKLCYIWGLIRCISLNVLKYSLILKNLIQLIKIKNKTWAPLHFQSTIFCRKFHFVLKTNKNFKPKANKQNKTPPPRLPIRTPKIPRAGFPSKTYHLIEISESHTQS